MKTERETTRIVRSWLEVGADRLPDRVLDSVLEQLPQHRQRHRPLWWPGRFSPMNPYAKMAIAAAAVLVVAVLGYSFLPRTPSSGVGPTTSPSPSPSPSASPMAFYEGSLAAGTYTTTPFSAADALGVCVPEALGCTESPADDSIKVTFTLPAGWSSSGYPSVVAVWRGDAATGLDVVPGLLILRGGSLYSDPCHATPPPEISVGPTVDDFANALADHPQLDATTPTSVSLGGYSGKYVDLQLPADVSLCTPDGEFRPWEPGMYAQGPSQRWHLWILDVDGIRLVVQSMDYATTPVADQAELQAVVNSIQIQS